MTTKMKLLIWGLRVYLHFLSIISIKKASLVAFRIFSTPIRKAKPTKPDVFNLAKPLSLTIETYRIIGYKWEYNNQKKALIVHGFESRAYNFEKYIQPLIDLGFDVYAMDAKAHGDSEGKTIVLPDYLAIIKELEKQFGKFDVYLGHSFGGLALSLYLESNPNPSSKAILIAPATETSTAIQMFCKFLHLSPKIEKGILQLILERAGVSVDFYSIKRALPQIKSKILWFHDLNDDITPYTDAKLVFDTKQANATFITTHGLGHRRIYKDEKVMNQIFKYIAE